MSVIWLTGTPCSGKTTVALELKKGWGEDCRILDGDEIRKTICADLKPGPEGRAESLRRIIERATKELTSHRFVVVAVVSPDAKNRTYARGEIEGKGHQFVEVFVKASTDACRTRDVKGLYARAAAGEAILLPGYNDSYETPDHPDVVCETEGETVEESAGKILSHLGLRA
jgi:adenylylsulfate kinase